MYLQVNPVQLPSTRELLKLFRIKSVKQLSQNFLLDVMKIEKFVRNIGALEGAEVCEVGPGPGGITRSIIDRNPSKLILIEKDRKFKTILSNLAAVSPVPVEIHYADILKFDMSNLFSDLNKNNWDDKPPSIYLVGNLPFSVSTHLIIRWMKDISYKRNAWTYGRVRMTLTFQDEVALRITSPESTDIRCRLSVMCQNWCKVKYNFKITKKHFIPKPKVNTGVVSFEPLINPIINADFELIEKFVRVSFNCRQKTIKNNVRNLFPQESREDLTEEIFNKSGINPRLKPYELSVEDFGKLVFSYKAICDRDPRLYKYNYRDSKVLKEFNWKISDEEDDNSDENNETYVSSQYIS